MAEINQFGSAKPARSGIGASCAQCEAMLTDAIDGTLSAADQAAFDRHLATCAPCSEMLAEAQRGAALLSMLKLSRPEPSSTLLDRIIAQTSGKQASTFSTTQAAANSQFADSGPLATDSLAAPVLAASGLITFPGPGSAKILPFTSRIAKGFNLHSIGQAMLQPRLAMTAAMAFFSVALTLNLTGVHLNDLRATDLKPANLKRSLYESGAHVVRYYDNLRVVYELESRVHDLQRSSDSDAPAAAPAPKSDPAADPNADKPQKQGRPKPGSGTSQRQNQNLFHPVVKLAKLVLSEDRLAEQLHPAPPSPRIDLASNPVFTNKFKDLEPKGGLV